MKPKIELVTLDKLQTNERNPRYLRESSFLKLRASLEKRPNLLLLNPIKATQDGTIIAGNQRYRAALDLGWKEIPVIYSTLSEEENNEFMLLDNAHYGEWDTDMLANEWDAALLEDFNIPFFFPEETSISGITDEDDIPAIKEEVRTKLGNIYKLGDHRLMCGDSTSKEDVDKLFNGSRASFLFTSPPYASQREYNGGKDLSVEKLSEFISASSSYVDVLAINLGLSRKDGEVNTYWDEYINRARLESYKFLSWNVWDRSNLGGSIGNQTATFPIWHEWILVFGRDRIELNKTKKNKTAGSKRGTNRQADGTLKKGRGVTGEWGKMGSVIATQMADGKLHPAMFPVELPEAYIKACTKKGEIIYEPFTGSGTTIIASEKLDRVCYGMELDPKYCDVIVKRWEDYTGGKAELL